jgi:hypothetical protein
MHQTFPMSPAFLMSFNPKFARKPLLPINKTLLFINWQVAKILVGYTLRLPIEKIDALSRANPCVETIIKNQSDILSPSLSNSDPLGYYMEQAKVHQLAYSAV